jgi:hypothetical protein
MTHVLALGVGRSDVLRMGTDELEDAVAPVQIDAARTRTEPILALIA